MESRPGVRCALAPNRIPTKGSRPASACRWATPKSRRRTIFRPTAIGLTRADPSHLRPLPKLLVSGSILNVQYEWDNSKRDANLRKHGVDFWDAILALEDPNRLEDIDERDEYGDERIAIIGVANDRVLFVIVTLRGEGICRIISARKAERHEQDRYYTGDRETW
jgi:uncharacterized protein